MAAEPRNRASLYRSSSEIIVAICSGGARSCDVDLGGCGSGVEELVRYQDVASCSRKEQFRSLTWKVFQRHSGADDFMC